MKNKRSKELNPWNKSISLLVKDLGKDHGFIVVDHGFSVHM